MILLDASALIAFLRAEKAERQVREMLRGGDAAITSVNLAETVDVLGRVGGVAPSDLDEMLAPLLGSALMVIPIGEREARIGGSIRATRYHHKRAPVSLADCLLMGAALTHGAAIATVDQVLADVAEQVAIEVLRLGEPQFR